MRCSASCPQGAAPGSRRRAGGSGLLARRSLSLLEAIEGLGQAGSVGQDVEVVVQRVYSVPVSDGSPGSALKARLLPPGSSAAPPPAEKGKTRYLSERLIAGGFYFVT